MHHTIGSRFFRQFEPLRHQEENLVCNLRAFQKPIFFDIGVTHGCTHYFYQSSVIISYCNEWYDTRVWTHFPNDFTSCGIISRRDPCSTERPAEAKRVTRAGGGIFFCWFGVGRYEKIMRGDAIVEENNRLFVWSTRKHVALPA